MTKYEIISLIISGIAILIPIFQWIFRKFIQKPKLNYYPNGKASVFFNIYGPYIRIDGTYEAINKPISIKKIKLSIVREKDGGKLNLFWACFISPFTQNIMNAVSSNVVERAHPFRIEENSVVCSFTEFWDEYNSFYKKFNIATQKLFDEIPNICKSHEQYNDALNEYINSNEYKTVKEKITRDFFWEIGKYDLEISVSYLNKIKVFKYTIEINESDYQKLFNNIDELLVFKLKNVYRINSNFNVIDVEMR